MEQIIDEVFDGKGNVISSTTRVKTQEQIQAEARHELAATDKEVARVAEDVIALLVSKGMFTESELPVKAQETIAKRKALRGQLV